jgi:hypothetical protein
MFAMSIRCHIDKSQIKLLEKREGYSVIRAGTSREVLFTPLINSGPYKGRSGMSIR